MLAFVSMVVEEFVTLSLCEVCSNVARAMVIHMYVVRIQNKNMELM